MLCGAGVVYLCPHSLKSLPKPGLRRPAKSTGLFRKDGVQLKLTFMVNFNCTLTFDI